MGDDENHDLNQIERGTGYDEEPSETEDPTETEEYYDVDLVEGETQRSEPIRRSWMELLSDNLARHESSDEEGADLPSLTSYSTSSSSRSPH